MAPSLELLFRAFVAGHTYTGMIVYDAPAPDGSSYSPAGFDYFCAQHELPLIPPSTQRKWLSRFIQDYLTELRQLLDHVHHHEK